MPEVRRRARQTRRLLVVLAVTVAMVATITGCSSGGDTPSSSAPPVSDGSAPVVYVALGGRETNNSDRRDLPDNWPQIVFAEAIPPGGVYVNLATDDATVQSALDQQLPQAVDLHPTVASVWLESADVRAATSAADYRRQLTALVEGLRSAGATTILLLTPSGAATDPAAEARGDLADAVAQVATATGATLVPLGDVSDRSDDRGQRRIADQVARAVRGADR